LSALGWVWLLAFASIAAGCDECEADTDCPGVEICSDGQCEALVCALDTDCTPGQRCSGNRCVAAEDEKAPPPDSVTLP
jgi:hypothetical protein